MPAAHRWALVFLTLAFSYECFERARWSNNTFYLDKDLQAMAARSLLEGRGLTVPYVEAADLALPADEPVGGWPPGYSLFLAPLLTAFDDHLDAVLTLEVGFAAAFFAIAWRLLLALPLSAGVRLAICAWWALVASPLSKLGASDMLALTFFSAALLLGIRLVERGSGNLATVALLALAALTRFAYWPLAPTIACGMALLVWRGRSDLKRPLLVQLVLLAVAIGAVAAFQAHESDHATHLTLNYSPSETGLFFEQLGEVVPFPASVIGVYEPFRNVRKAGRLPEWAGFFGEAVLWLFSAVLIAITVRSLLLYPRGDPQLAFCASTAFAAATTVAMLLVLTVRYKTWTRAPIFDGWVYAQELRYYAPLTWVLVAGLGYWLSQSWPGWERSRRLAVVALVLALGLGPFAVRLRRAALEATPGYVNSYEARWRSDWETIRETVHSIRAAGDQVVYLGSDPRRQRFAGLSGARMTHPGSALHSSQPVTLLAALPTGDAELDQRIRRRGARAGELRSGELWLVALGAATGRERLQLESR